MTDYHNCSVKLEGEFSTYSISFAVPIPDRMVSSDELLADESHWSPQILIRQEYTSSTEEPVVVNNTMSIWALEVSELLDASLCLSYIGETADTQLPLKYNRYDSSRVYMANQAVYQSFYGSMLLMWSKGNEKHKGKRFIEIHFSDDNSNERVSEVVLVVANVEEVANCAATMLRTYEEVESVVEKHRRSILFEPDWVEKLKAV